MLIKQSFSFSEFFIWFISWEAEFYHQGSFSFCFLFLFLSKKGSWEIYFISPCLLENIILWHLYKTNIRLRIFFRLFFFFWSQYSVMAMRRLWNQITLKGKLPFLSLSIRSVSQPLEILVICYMWKFFFIFEHISGSVFTVILIIWLFDLFYLHICSLSYYIFLRDILKPECHVRTWYFWSLKCFQ